MGRRRVLAEGASPVTEAGVCWGTSPSPAFGNCEGAVALSSGTQRLRVR